MHVYSIDPGSGALKPLSTAPLAESFPYISLDRTGRFLFGASYGGHLVSVNAVGGDGRVAAEPLQVIPVGRNAHSIRADASNRFVFVPNLGTDQIFQFVFDEKSGRLASNTPAVAQMKQGTGPRHFIFSSDNRFVYLLSELVATVTTLSLDGKTGLLTEVSSASALPPDSRLQPGAPRGRFGERETLVSLERADGEAAARIRDRSQGKIPRRVRGKIGNHLRLCDRPGERRAQAAAEGSDGERLELGGDRRLRLKSGATCSC